MEIIHYIEQMALLASKGNRQGAFFFVAVYAFIVFHYSVIYQLRIRAWPKTKGKLLQADIERFGAPDLVKANQEYIAASIYTYTLDGKEYQGHRISSWIIVASHNLRFLLQKQLQLVKENQDGIVDVYYNPKKPQKSFLLKPGKIGLVFTLFLAIAPTLLYVSEYYW